MRTQRPWSVRGMDADRSPRPACLLTTRVSDATSVVEEGPRDREAVLASTGVLRDGFGTLPSGIGRDESPEVLRLCSVLTELARETDRGRGNRGRGRYSLWGLSATRDRTHRPAYGALVTETILDLLEEIYGVDGSPLVAAGTSSSGGRTRTKTPRRSPWNWGLPRGLRNFGDLVRRLFRTVGDPGLQVRGLLSEGGPREDPTRPSGDRIGPCRRFVGWARKILRRESDGTRVRLSPGSRPPRDRGDPSGSRSRPSARRETGKVSCARGLDQRSASARRRE